MYLAGTFEGCVGGGGGGGSSTGAFLAPHPPNLALRMSLGLNPPPPPPWGLGAGREGPEEAGLVVVAAGFFVAEMQSQKL